MAWTGNTHRTFQTVADVLIREHASDDMKRDVLAALMDHIGVPVAMMYDPEHGGPKGFKYRRDPAIRALFAERGVTVDTNGDPA